MGKNSGDDALIGGMVVFLAFFGAAVASAVLGIVNAADGFGYVDIEQGSYSNAETVRATFGFFGVCLSRVNSDDDAPSRSQLNDDTTTAVDCLAYKDATLGTLTDRMPVGQHTLAKACAQLVAFDSGLAIAGVVIAFSAILIVPLTLRRACTICCFGGRDATKSFYVCTSRSVIAVAFVQLIGNLMLFAAIAPIADSPDLLLAERGAPWYLQEQVATGDTSSRTRASFDVRADPSNWLGYYAFIPSIVVVVLTFGMEALMGCFRPEGLGPIFPCCSAGDGSSVGVCGDPLFKDGDCSKIHAVCVTSSRRTRDDHIDDCAVDCMRICGFVPLGALHLASLVFGVLQATDSGPLFEFEVRGSVLNGTRSTSATVTYTMSARQGCLEGTTYTLGRAGYAARDCFDIDKPRQLTLRRPGTTDPAPATDFSLTTMAAIAPTLQAAQAAAEVRALSGAIVVVCLVVFLVCNMRRGKAAAAFKIWGKVVNMFLLAALVFGLMDSVEFSSTIDSIRRRRMLAALRGASIDEDDDYGMDLLGVSSPLAGPLTFEPRYVDIDSGSYGGLDSLVMGFSAAQLVMLLPVAIVGFCSTFNGNGKVESDTPSGPELLTSTAGAATPAGVASPASERAAPVKTTQNPYAKAARPDDSSDYGCLASVRDAAKRADYEQQAQELASMVREVRAAGVAGAVERGLMQTRPKIVRKRAHELLSKPKAASDRGDTESRVLAALSASTSGPAASSPAAATPTPSAPTKTGPPPPEEPAVPAFPGNPASAPAPPAFPYPTGAQPPGPHSDGPGYPSSSGPMLPSAAGPGYPGMGAAAAAYPGMGAPAAAYPGMGAPAAAYPGMGAPAAAYPGMGAPAAAYPGMGATGGAYPPPGQSGFGAPADGPGPASPPAPAKPAPPGGSAFPDNFAL
ncbi:hypothetical protein FNF29_03322 [Cafeteria roenbergensis]|uniref:Uncharacterized protein n=1 Tax=Cafeteria roenbergensis TaxID=33653 RepID=A0A5A8CKT6_CAFRO|nr:hypothetical protein FNF29_03322 [Cafeteria roenbergensis]|eukprot:KAA0153134.1 hypothetical protein FNF29_03322 [Cafeteria roenbergensis]